MCISSPSYAPPSTAPTVVEKREILEEDLDEPLFRFQPNVGGDKLGKSKSKGTQSLRKRMGQPDTVNTPQSAGATLRIS